MILTTRLLNMRAGTISPPAITTAATESDIDWIFAPHMYGNPFQDVLNGRLDRYSIRARGFRQIGAAVEAISISNAEHRVLHLHWLNVVLAGARSAAEEEKRIANFSAHLTQAKASGAKIVWTVHNVLPHEGYSEAAAIRVRELIVEAADWVHVMSPTTVLACAPVFKIPAEKVLRIDHPGYHGVYPEVDSAVNLRMRWGLPVAGKVIVILGGIKPYKGLNQFAKEFLHATSNTPRELTLLIAGKPSEPLLNTELWKLAELSANLHVLPETVSDNQVSELMTLADLVAIPYQASLNSGALALALTYAKPVLARSTAGSTHLLADGAGKTYSSEAELLTILNDHSWLDAAAIGAADMSRRLERERMVDLFAQAARAFSLHGLAQAREIVGANGGISD